MKTTLSKNQDKEAAKSGLSDTIGLDNVLWSTSNHEISARAKTDVMQQTVARCPKVCISCKGVKILSLLNLGSEVSIICQSYFNEHLLPKVMTLMGEMADNYFLFCLTMVNDGQLPLYIHQIGCQAFRASGAECRFPHIRGTKSSPG